MGTPEEAETLPTESPACGEERIVVSVRLRPLNEKENSRNDVSDWECLNHNTILYRNNLSPSDRSLYPPAYTFDRVFGPECSTAKVYAEGAKEVALSVVDGINSSVFAYGQTSSGKTYTMSGITEYTVADIYDHIEKHNEREFFLKLSAIEIYNESVRDLLSSDPTPLRLLDDPERGTVVEKLTEETVAGWSHFKELISLCEAHRQIGETNLNEASSRSHQILRLVVESCTREPSSSVLAASVNFVDLAGSERASQSLSAGTRLKEGCHINRSLLTLGTVIRKLSKGRSHHIPFRDSKLTRILQSSLGGNSRTAIICTMSPARVHVEQSRNTLLFASCAKEITTNARVNVVVSDKALVKHLRRELARLENELRSSSLSSPSNDVTRLMTEKDLQIEKLNKHVEELTLQLGDARTQIQTLIKSPEEFETCKANKVNYPSLRVRESWESECSYSTDSVVICDGSTRTFTEASEEETADDVTPSQWVSVGSVSYVDCKDVRDEQDDTSVESYAPYCEEEQNIEVRESCVAVTNGDGSVVAANDEAPQRQVNEPKPQSLRFPLCDKVSPLFTEDACFSSRSLRMTRSRSCKGRIMDSYGDYWFEIETPRFEMGFSQRTAMEARQPRNSMRDLVAADTSVPENSNKSSLIIEASTSTGALIYPKNTENRNERNEGGAAVASPWPSEFKKLRQEIIDLWDKCNVSLVHRSYFFLLFEGDSSDSLYVEVEHRRLSFLYDTISRGATTLVNGQEFTVSSSKKALVRERNMLGRRMSRSMGAEERIDAFVKWGIELSSSKRRLQLAHRIWTDTWDLDHIARSAHLVAKLVVLKESHQTLREMFGLLNFSPKRPTWRASSLWRH